LNAILSLYDDQVSEKLKDLIATSNDALRRYLVAWGRFAGDANKCQRAITESRGWLATE
jgi:hypothetical protein